MYAIAVLDDDIGQAEEIARMIEKSSSRKRLGGAVVLRPAELPSWLAAGNRADILLSDIKLEDGGPNGIDLVERHFPKESGTQIIYVTGYAGEYFTEVYRTDHVYLVEKPVAQDRLDRALEKACEKLAEMNEQPIMVQFGKTTHIVQPGRIVYVESVGRKLKIVLGDSVIETYMKIDQMKEMLPPAFCQCHKSFLANLAHVAAIDGLILAMDDGSRVPITKTRRYAVKSALARFARKML